VRAAPAVVRGLALPHVAWRVCISPSCPASSHPAWPSPVRFGLLDRPRLSDFEVRARIDLSRSRIAVTTVGSRPAEGCCGVFPLRSAALNTVLPLATRAHLFSIDAAARGQHRHAIPLDVRRRHRDGRWTMRQSSAARPQSVPPTPAVSDNACAARSDGRSSNLRRALAPFGQLVVVHVQTHEGRPTCGAMPMQFPDLRPSSVRG